MKSSCRGRLTLDRGTGRSTIAQEGKRRSLADCDVVVPNAPVKERSAIPARDLQAKMTCGSVRQPERSSRPPGV
jgi:hypothetical protein